MYFITHVFHSPSRFLCINVLHSNVRDVKHDSFEDYKVMYYITNVLHRTSKVQPIAIEVSYNSCCIPSVVLLHLKCRSISIANPNRIVLFSTKRCKRDLET